MIQSSGRGELSVYYRTNSTAAPFADFRTTASRTGDLDGLNAALASGASSIATDYITDDRRFSNYHVRAGRAGRYVVRQTGHINDKIKN